MAEELEMTDQSEKKSEMINDANPKKSSTLFETNQGIELSALGKLDSASSAELGGGALQEGGKSKRRKYTEISVLSVLIVTVWILFSLPTLFYLSDVSPIGKVNNNIYYNWYSIYIP